MKCLILFALVAIAASYTPSVDDYSCLMCGDPHVVTFDNVNFIIDKASKFLMTEVGVGGKEASKIQIRCVVHDDFFNDELDEPMWVDWCGFGFFPHNNKNKYFRNWILGQDPENIIGRGQGNGGDLSCLSLSEVQTFPYVNEPRDGKLWSKAKDHIPAECFRADGEPVMYTATADQYGIKIRSDCMPWAVDWMPAGRDTCIRIWAPRNSQWTGMTRGICGNMNGNSTDDWTDASGFQNTPNLETSIEQIVNSFADGKHKAQNYNGGEKMWNTCGDTLDVIGDLPWFDQSPNP